MTNLSVAGFGSKSTFMNIHRITRHTTRGVLESTAALASLFRPVSQTVGWINLAKQLK